MLEPQRAVLDDLIIATLHATKKRNAWRDAFGLAYVLGLDPVYRDRLDAALVGNSIEYSRLAAPHERQRLVARECARYALREWRLPETKNALDYVAHGLVQLPSALPLASLA